MTVSRIKAVGQGEGGPQRRNNDDGTSDQLTEPMNNYERQVLRFLFALARDRVAAQDCSQDTFMQAFENLRKGKPVNGQWLYR